MPNINTKVLMSGANYFDDGFAINAYMDEEVPVDVNRAMLEHQRIRDAFVDAGIEVIKVDAPEHCQDGVYTANWALVRGKKAVMSQLPNKRHAEQPVAARTLTDMGYDIVHLPANMPFSGQGDALFCGDYLFVGSNYRTDPAVHPLLAREFGVEVIGLETIPQLDEEGEQVINRVTGWPDSFFYDLDLALAVLSPTMIAWCPEAFTAKSQERIRAIKDIDKIEVSLQEAQEVSACNLVSTGETVVMGDRAPQLQAAIEAKGLKVITVDVSELMKGGGFIRCTSLTLS